MASRADFGLAWLDTKAAAPRMETSTAVRRPNCRVVQRRFLAGESIYDLARGAQFWGAPHTLGIDARERLIEDALRRAMLLDEKRRRRK